MFHERDNASEMSYFLRKMEHLNIMEHYIPEKLPLTFIDWERHISNIAQANSNLARFDGILQTIPNPELLLAVESFAKLKKCKEVIAQFSQVRELLQEI
jgi:hypothetical protein